MDGVPTDWSLRTVEIPRERVEKPEMRFSPAADRLFQFQDRFVFFTIAIPYLWGGFRERVLIDFIASQQQPVGFYHKKFDRPLFRGLNAPNGDTDWNHVLWATEIENWEAFEAHICSTVLSSREQQTVVKYPAQELVMLDPLFAERHPVLPSQLPVVTIQAFAAKTNTHTVAFENDRPAVLQPPAVYTYDPDEELLRYAHALFTEEDPRFLSGDPDDETPPPFYQRAVAARDARRRAGLPGPEPRRAARDDRQVGP